MRTSSMVMASLLLFLLLATRAHGIRMDRQLHDALSSKEPAGDSKAAAQPSELAAHSASKHCASDGRCSDAGKAKKAAAPAHAAKHHQPIPGGGKREEEEEEAAPSSRVLPRQENNAAATTYPDILDIAGMDYTPANRKPPIHN
ncbi:uncharacterized protein LOC104581444 [Brachypodium distachyon]|uniref:Uncharacterized protein n=1 Tax=Brachypodium distachyon TaxID=15368 RepID=I1J2H4_BRADI|nr:uncharacterized protein LOC104581444 [Brachypodium distachyon]KQJ84931.2 hypothetical protein BRADI_5g23717v3 [Brachypodium distachyon]|eukprot:XP_014751235.1 uncharacterized protein LOC104581444 [Brachypodium distachyon]